MATTDRPAPEDLWWYHTIDLGNGVVTKGWFDCRPIVDTIGFPSSLAGKRCLDIGTFDGFWAYEMERRGASEVVAIDVLDHMQWDWPPSMDPSIAQQMGRAKNAGVGFEVARAALQSKVERLELSVYDLDPEVHGQFDFVYMGSLILHLRDPIRALDAVRRVCPSPCSTGWAGRGGGARTSQASPRCTGPPASSSTANRS
jgi:tRNA (mo5U34)-methyltransferase